MKTKLTQEFLHEHTDDICYLMEWWLTKDRDGGKLKPTYYRMKKAGFETNEVINEAWISLLKNAKGQTIDFKLSTLAINSAKWTLWRLIKKQEQTITIEDKFPDDIIDENPDDLDKTVERNELQTAVKRQLNKLTYRHRHILNMRYGLGDGANYTLEETGRVFKIARERVRQLENKAIIKMQHHSIANHLKGHLDYCHETT